MAEDKALIEQTRADLKSGVRDQTIAAISKVETAKLDELFEDVYAAFSKSTDPHIRRKALFVMSRRGAPQVLQMVLDAIDDPKCESFSHRHLGARELALQKVARTKNDPVIFKAIREALGDEDVYYRKYGAAALASYPPAQIEFKDELRNVANDESAVVRFTFLGKLEMTDETEPIILPLILSAIRSEDAGDRIAAAYALAKRTSWPKENSDEAEKLVSFLIGELGNADESLSGAAGYALVFLKRWEGLEDKIRAAANSDSSKVRIYAATALHELSKSFETEPLEGVFQTDSEELQLRLTWLLSRQRTEDGIALLSKGLGSKFPNVRKSAVFALRSNGWIGEFEEMGQKPNGRPVSTLVLRTDRTPEEQARYDAAVATLAEAKGSTDSVVARLSKDALVRVGERAHEDLLIDHEAWKARASERPERKLNEVAMPKKHLFIDDFVVEKMEGVERVFHSFEKHPENPVFHAQAPWEENWVDNFMCSVHYDPASRDFKLWYRCGANHTLGGYAVSEDGIGWKRPNLGLIEYKGSKDTNLLGWKAELYRDAHQPGHNISILPDAEQDRRYLSFFDYSGEKRGFYVSYSPEGIHWSEPEHAQMVYGDVATVIPDPIKGGFEFFPKQALWIDGYRRSFGYTHIKEIDAYGPKTYPFIARTNQHDELVGIEAAKSFGVLARNTLDPAVPSYYSNWHTQIYSVTPLIYEGLVLGFYDLWYLTGKREGPLEMLGRATRDRKEWFDIGYPKPFLARGKPGEWDCGMVYGGSNILVVDDEIRFYYSGFNLGHYTDNPWGSLPHQVMGVGLATMRLDGFASVRAGENSGILTTKPVEVTGAKLLINAKAEGGSVGVEVLEESGKAIAELGGRMEGGDQLRFPIADLSKVQGQKVRFRFTLQGADLFSFWFE